jgi:predicted Zn-dependent protease
MTEEAEHELLDERLRDALSLAEDGREAEAFELLQACEEDHPDDPTLLCSLGVLARQLELGETAFAYFRRCLDTAPTDPAVLAAAGSGLAAFDDPDAEPALRLAALSAPALTAARLRYGAYLAREGLLDQAITELEAARGLDEGSAEVRFELGSAYLLAARTAEGIDELAAAIGLSDDDAWIRGLRALALSEAGRDVEAAEELHAVAAEEPEDGEMQVAAALACAAQGWDDEAWVALSRAEAAAAPAEAGLLMEAEEALELGPDAAETMLREHVAPSLLRDRLGRGL